MSTLTQQLTTPKLPWTLLNTLLLGKVIEIGFTSFNLLLLRSESSKDLTTVVSKLTLTDMESVMLLNMKRVTSSSQSVFLLDLLTWLLFQKTLSGQLPYLRTKLFSKKNTTLAISLTLMPKTCLTSPPMLWLFLTTPMEYVTQLLKTVITNSITQVVRCSKMLVVSCNEIAF